MHWLLNRWGYYTSMTKVYAHFDNQFEAHNALGELTRFGFETEYVPMGKKEVVYTNHFLRLMSTIQILLLGLFAGFAFGGLLGFFDAVGIINLASIRDFLIGKDFLTTLNLSWVRIEIITWGFSGMIFGLIVGGLTALKGYQENIVEASLEAERVMLKIVSRNQQKIKEIILAHQGKELVAS